MLSWSIGLVRSRVPVETMMLRSHQGSSSCGSVRLYSSKMAMKSSGRSIISECGVDGGFDSSLFWNDSCISCGLKSGNAPQCWREDESTCENARVSGSPFGGFAAILVSEGKALVG